MAPNTQHKNKKKNSELILIVKPTFPIKLNRQLNHILGKNK